MCLKKLHIKNPTRRVSLHGGQPAFLDVQCNQCAECMEAQRALWRFRSYYEIKHTLKNGYVYYDTLTYSNEYVPHISRFIDLPANVSDYMCFDSNDWRGFLKRLRSQLSYHYNGVSFKYFLTSEYGTDERYTHRPHYHILFFVDNSQTDTPLHPFELSKLVSSCWPYGRTDGFPYKTAKYVSENIFGYDVGFGIHNSDADVLKVCNYVSKYITKDSSFQKEINSRLALLRPLLETDDFTALSRNIRQFHRQSQGFGLYYITSMCREEYRFICDNGACRIKDSDSVVVTIPLPLYYKRKLFYNCYKRNDGTLFWQPNNAGIDYLYNATIRNIHKATDYYKTIYINLDSSSQQYIQQLLAGRSLEDFVIYKQCYKNRFRDFHSSLSLSDNEYNLYDWLKTINESLLVNTAPVGSYVDIDVDTDSFSIGSINDALKYDIPLVNDINYSVYAKQNTFNQNTCADFRNFDKLDSFFEFTQLQKRSNAQSKFDYIEDLTKKIKLLYEQ